MGNRTLRTLLSALLAIAATPLAAQTLPGVPPKPEAAAMPNASVAIAAKTDVTSDTDIATRIRSIFGEIAALRGVRVRVSAGVVTLTGTVPNPGDVMRAEAIAGRVAGVVTVQNDVERDLKVDSNLAPVVGQIRGRSTRIATRTSALGGGAWHRDPDRLDRSPAGLA